MSSYEQPGHINHEQTANGDLHPMRLAASATLHCLTGCAIGEIAGMAIGTALGWSAWQTIGLAIALAFAFGYLLSATRLLRAGLPMRTVLPLAFAADTVSIAVMEIADNGFMLAMPGAMTAGLDDAVFWVSLAAALAFAFVVTVPVNRMLIARGRGHAVLHGHHHRERRRLALPNRKCGAMRGWIRMPRSTRSAPAGRQGERRGPSTRAGSHRCSPCR